MPKQKQSLVVRFTNYFIKNPRLSLLLIPVVIVLGLTSYQGLQRDGFPPIELPIVFVNTVYPVNDQELVNTDVTIPLESLIKDNVDGWTTFRSTTNPNLSSIVVSFADSITSEEGANRIELAIRNFSQLSDELNTSVVPLKAVSLDNKSDMIFSIGSTAKSIGEIQETASIVAEQLTKLPEIEEAYAIEQIKTRINPITGQSFEQKESFGRFIQKSGSELITYDSVQIGVVKANETLGVIDISDAVRSTLASMQTKDGILEDYAINYSGDFSDSLRNQISSLESNALSAILIIVAILFFLINWRASALLALFFPLTLGSVFIAFAALGYSLNTISLFALILVLGLFVDDGIIIVEAIDAAKKQGLKGKKAVESAIAAIGEADILGTVTTVLVFVPLLFISGPLGEFISLIPITVILSLVISLLIALTLLPWLSMLFLKNKSEKISKTSFIQNTFVAIENFTLNLGKNLAKFVNFYLSEKSRTVAVILMTILAIIAGSSFASQLKFNIFPASKDGDSISIILSFDNGQSMVQVEELANQVDQKIKSILATDIEKYEYFRATERGANITIKLTPITSREITSQDLSIKLQSELDNIEGISALVSSAIAGPPPQRRPFNMQIFSEDVGQLFEITSRLDDFISSVELEGTEVTEVFVAGTDSLSKIQGRRFAQIEVGFDENQTSATLHELQELIKKDFISNINSEFNLSSEDITFDGGVSSANFESFAGIQTAFLISILVMYVLLMLQFNSFSQPVLILLAIPFSFVLLFPGLYLTNNDLSFFVTVGLTALVGIVVNNSIVLIEYTNEARSQGSGIKDSIVYAIEKRFRPILGTTITSVVGLLPLALTEPFWEPLAFTIIFGLVSSSIFVLVSYPAFFVVFEKLRERRIKLFKKLFYK